MVSCFADGRWWRLLGLLAGTWLGLLAGMRLFLEAAGTRFQSALEGSKAKSSKAIKRICFIGFCCTAQRYGFYLRWARVFSAKAKNCFWLHDLVARLRVNVIDFMLVVAHWWVNVCDFKLVVARFVGARWRG